MVRVKIYERHWDLLRRDPGRAFHPAFAGAVRLDATVPTPPHPDEKELAMSGKSKGAPKQPDRRIPGQKSGGGIRPQPRKR